jgi:hypothetical protein
MDVEALGPALPAEVIPGGMTRLARLIVPGFPPRQRAG